MSAPHIPFHFRLTVLAAALYCAMAHSAEPMPIEVEADNVVGTAQGQTEAKGNVQLHRGDLDVNAEWAKFDHKTNRVTAGDQVEMTRQGDVLKGNQLDYLLDTKYGSLTQPDYAMAQGLGRGDAVKLLFEGDDKYRLSDGRFTTCQPGDNAWFLHANELELDYTTNKGIAHSAWLEFKGAPIMYMPWMNFPLNSNRQTGFLAPSFSTNNRNGFEFSTPFYWNIAPNYDFTLTPRYMSRRGIMLGGEFRYLKPDYAGTLKVEGLSSDAVSGSDRSSIVFQHQQALTERLSLSLNVQKVSDNDYFNDFGDRLSVASQTNLPREAVLSYRGDNWQAFGRWQRFQTIQSTTNPVDEPYARVPQLGFSANPEWIPGLQLSIAGEATEFNHSTKINGTRVWAKPEVSMPFNNSYGFIKPKLSVHASSYQLRANGANQLDSTENRVVPIFSVDSGLYFEKESQLWGEDYTQTLEPRAYYAYVPYRDQSKLPNFDSAITDFSFAQMFSENQFSGNDRINDANQLTLALSSRLYESSTGIERVRATIGQRFYFTEQRVTLDAPGRPDETTTSDLLLSVSGQVWRDFMLGYSLQYNAKDDRTIRSDVNLGWSPGAFRALNMRYVINSNSNIEQLDFSGQWPLGGGWYAIGRANYSLRDNKALETLGGVEYNAGCWALRFAAQRYITNDGTFNTNFFALLELGGLGGLGSNPIDVLRQTIPGYTDTYSKVY
ncbi:LPS-assembly protein LptD [Iodobacter sp.]|uniref:LPS-assembly protein LptD n=1 Tax=Iodobacter sp. TaxID=1915058 RepID=UPI0025E0CC7C|nr:LPS-assembly protein LptD [Iodobacter sp.]